VTEKSKAVGIEPVGHHVLVRPDQVAEKSTGGIFLAPTARENEQRASITGHVIGVGATAWIDVGDGSPWAKVGDYVSYARYSGFELQGLDGEKYVLLNDQDILAILSEERETCL
jgi:chaperonin GroES